MFILHKRSATGGAATGCAAEAVVVHGDRVTLELSRIEFPEEERCRILPPHVELLIEVAVIDYTSPIDA